MSNTETKKSGLKELDLKTDTFTANGRTYKILSRMPMSRYKQFRKLQHRLVYGVDVETMLKNLMKIYNYCNSPKPEPVSAGIVAHNMMNGINDVADDSREEAALLLCALIIVREDENVGEHDPKLDIEKIRDWEKEGFAVDGFFQLALISIPEFTKTWNLYTSLQEKKA